MKPAVGQMLPPNIGQMMQPGVMQANMGQPIQNQQQKNYGYKPKFYNNGSKKRDKTNSICRACGQKGHWAGDSECSLNGVIVPSSTKAITNGADTLAQFNALIN